MAEENSNVQNQDAGNGQNNTPPVEQNSGSLAFLSGLKGFDETGFNKQMADLKKDKTPGAENGNQGQGGQNNTPATPAADNKEGAEGKEGNGTPKPGENPDKPVVEEEIETTLFGKQKVGDNKNKPAATPVEFKEFSDIQKYVESNHGVKDVNKFLTEVAPKWREQAQKYAEVDKKYNELMGVFEKLDDDLIDMFKANLQGDDWRQVMNQAPKLNFNKKVEDYSKEQLVEHYFPGKFSKEDFQDSDTENKALDVAYEAAKKSFATDKTVFDGKRATMVEQEQKRAEAFEKSITGSVEKLQKTLPLVHETVLKETGEILKSGAAGILNEFLNADGSLKEDAAQKLAMARHGIQTLETYMKFATKRSETEVREEFVSKGPDQLQGNNPGGQNKLSKKAEETLGMFKELGRKKFY